MSFKPTDDFVDYITNSDNVWNPERYLAMRKSNGVHEGIDYSFTYSYVLGNAYMTGLLGKENYKVEVFFQRLQNFQVVMTLDGELVERKSFPAHDVVGVKEMLASYAKQ